MNIPYISAEEVRKNLSMEDAIQCTENVYKLKSQDKTVVWPTIFYEFDPGHADMDIKSGYLPGTAYFRPQDGCVHGSKCAKRACRILWV